MDRRGGWEGGEREQILRPKFISVAKFVKLLKNLSTRMHLLSLGIYVDDNTSMYMWLYLGSAFGHASHFTVEAEFVVFIITTGQYLASMCNEECTVGTSDDRLNLLFNWQRQLGRNVQIILTTMTQPPCSK